MTLSAKSSSKCRARRDSAGVLLDKEGCVARIGTNTEEGIGGNRMPPERWQTGFVVAPHGVATNR